MSKVCESKRGLTQDAHFGVFNCLENLWLPFFFKFVYTPIVQFNFKITAKNKKSIDNVEERNLIFLRCASSNARCLSNSWPLKTVNGLLQYIFVDNYIELKEKLLSWLSQCNFTYMDTNHSISLPSSLRWNENRSGSLLITICVVYFSYTLFHGSCGGSKLSQNIHKSLNMSPSEDAIDFIVTIISIFLIAIQLNRWLFKKKHLEENVQEPDPFQQLRNLSAEQNTTEEIYVSPFSEQDVYLPQDVEPQQEQEQQQIQEEEEQHQQSENEDAFETWARNLQNTSNEYSEPDPELEVKQDDKKTNHSELEQQQIQEQHKVHKQSEDNSEEEFEICTARENSESSDSGSEIVESRYAVCNTLDAEDCKSKIHSIPVRLFGTNVVEDISFVVETNYKFEPFALVNTFEDNVATLFMVGVSTNIFGKIFFAVCNLAFVALFATTLLRTLLLPLAFFVSIITDRLVEVGFWTFRNFLTTLFISIAVRIHQIFFSQFKHQAKPFGVTLCNTFAFLHIAGPVIAWIYPLYYNMAILDLVQLFLCFQIFLSTFH